MGYRAEEDGRPPHGPLCPQTGNAPPGAVSLPAVEHQHGDLEEAIRLGVAADGHSVVKNRLLPRNWGSGLDLEPPSVGQDNLAQNVPGGLTHRSDSLRRWRDTLRFREPGSHHEWTREWFTPWGRRSVPSINTTNGLLFRPPANFALSKQTSENPYLRNGRSISSTTAVSILTTWKP